jgi:hypothetical protein
LHEKVLAYIHTKVLRFFPHIFLHILQPWTRELGPQRKISAKNVLPVTSLTLSSRFPPPKSAFRLCKGWTRAPRVTATPTSSRATTTASTSWRAAWHTTLRSRSSGINLLVSFTLHHFCHFKLHSYIGMYVCMYVGR